LEVAAAVLYPKGPGPKARYTSHLYQKGWAILKDAKYQQETVEFLKFLETGDRKIRMMHSVPLHYWPPRRSVVKDPRFLDNPLIKTPVGQRSLKVLAEALDQGTFALTETGTVVLKVGPLLENRLLSKSLQRVLLQSVSPKDSLAQASREVQEAK
jgi:ABC-type glycerol-3-phosphate transport system substrate-binding protein